MATACVRGNVLVIHRSDTNKRTIIRSIEFSMKLRQFPANAMSKSAKAVFSILIVLVTIYTVRRMREEKNSSFLSC